MPISGIYSLACLIVQLHSRKLGLFGYLLFHASYFYIPKSRCKIERKNREKDAFCLFLIQAFAAFHCICFTNCYRGARCLQAKRRQYSLSQIIGSFVFSRYIAFAMHLDIRYVWIHNKSCVSRKIKTTYKLEQRE
jgi:hypothetical protein